MYTMLDQGSPSFFNQAIGFTIGQDPGIFGVASLVLTIMLVACSIAAFGRVLYGIMLVVGTFGDAAEATIRKGKGIISSSLFYLLLSFSLVLIMLAINPDVVTGRVDLKGIQVGRGGAGTGTETQTQNPVNNQPSATYTQRLQSHNANVARLSAVGINTNRNNTACTEAQFKEKTPACTSLAYMKEETIQMLLKLKQECNCTLVITGATEPGHMRHGEDQYPVDLRIPASQAESDPLYAFLKRAGRSQGSSGTCYARYQWERFTFCDEKPRSNPTWRPHFHAYLE